MNSRREFCTGLAGLAAAAATQKLAAQAEMHAGPVTEYPDGRPVALKRMEARDAGPILKHGHGPNRCDYLGAREAICFQDGDTYYLHYDGAGPKGWLACLATSKDLKQWKLHGPVLDLGPAGADDSASASSPWTVFDGQWWYMYYLGCKTTTPPPDRIPSVPYFTLTARSKHPNGPWEKLTSVVPFHTQPGTYYADTASGGQVVKQGDEYLMFFSAAAFHGKDLKRTIAIARTRDLAGSWKVDAEPILPPGQQLENAALYYEPTLATWFLFANHIGLDAGGEYTDSIWVYWSKDLTKWNPEDRATVLDRVNCRWAVKCIGMPSVVKVGNKLAIFYDAPAKDTGHMQRDLGLAWLNLPLHIPQ